VRCLVARETCLIYIRVNMYIRLTCAE